MCVTEDENAGISMRMKVLRSRTSVEKCGVSVAGLEESGCNAGYVGVNRARGNAGDVLRGLEVPRGFDLTVSSF